MWWCNHHVVAWVIYLIQCLMLWSLRLCFFFKHYSSWFDIMRPSSVNQIIYRILKTFSALVSFSPHYYLDINNHPIISTMVTNKWNASSCSACWVPPIQTHPYLPACITALINYVAGFCVALFDCHHCWDSYAVS